jgi:hypothetical protein
MPHQAEPLWNQPEFLEQASSWIYDVLAQEGIKVSGAIVQAHVRPWSTVLRMPTGVGDVYFKACTPALGHEASVTQALYSWRPDCIPQVLRIDAAQGWMLMADGGPSLRHAFGNGLDRRSWAEILALYASLQIDLAGHVDKLLQLGAPDRRLLLLPDLYQQLLADEDWLLIDQPYGLTRFEYQRLIDAAPQVMNLCQRLAAYAIPMSLHHNDLHDGNIFSADGRTLFFDWGDSSIAHPFFSLRTVFVSIEHTFNVDEEDPFFDKLAHTYLQPWTAYSSLANVEAAFKLAQRLWSLSSAVKYKTLLSQLDSIRDEYALAVPSLLQEFLQANLIPPEYSWRQLPSA